MTFVNFKPGNPKVIDNILMTYNSIIYYTLVHYLLSFLFVITYKPFTAAALLES